MSTSIATISITTDLEDKAGSPVTYCTAGDVVTLHADTSGLPGLSSTDTREFSWQVTGGSILESPDDQKKETVHWDTTGTSGVQTVEVAVKRNNTPEATGSLQITVRLPFVIHQVDGLPVSMQRTQTTATRDQALWAAIRNRTRAIRFESYTDFVDKVLCNGNMNAVESSATTASMRRQAQELYVPVHGVGSYELLKTATQVFLLLECGVKLSEKEPYSDRELYSPDDETGRMGTPVSFDDMQQRLSSYLGGGNLPYIERVLSTAFQGYVPVDSVFCEGYLGGRADCPVLLELIWSYWHEEAMLVQTMNALSLRFQNRRSGAGRDPLAHLEIAPLYPINNLIFGHIQDEVFRTSIKRRAYEYDHHYGISPIGKAVGAMHPADSRSQFLEAFHNLLYKATLFHKQSDDTTMIPDGFPVLSAIKEVHLILAQGAHNQYGDLPWMARAEMLMQQWILARPEMREFLQTRAMVPYKEAWMPAVDAMKTMQGWMGISVTHFHDLAEYGEQLLLAIRLGDWVDVNDPLSAANWAVYWRPEIQSYLHAYRVVTGVDLTLEPRDAQQARLRVTQPAIMLQQRLGSGAAAPALPDPEPTAAAAPFREHRAARR